MTGLTKDALETLLARGAMHAPFNTMRGGQAFILPTGYTLEELPPVNEPLTHIKQAVTLHDADSFIAYVNRYKTEATRLFASPGFLNQGAPIISAAIDYHVPNAADPTMPGLPDRVAHIANYPPRYSDQWVRWTKACMTWKQAEFAELIEEVRADIRSPDAAALLDIISTFKASKGVDFDSLTHQRDGSVMLKYSEKVQQDGKAVLPETFQLGIPVYFRDDAYAVNVFVRFRLSGGGVTFTLKLDRPDVIEDEAFKALVGKVAEGTEIEVYLGKRS